MENISPGISMFSKNKPAEDQPYDLLPLFEKLKSDRLLKQKYSLQSNEVLKEQWELYKENFSTRVFTPFQFPDVNDYHFFKFYTRLIPNETIKNWKDYKMKLRPGPGVDYQGQMPMPNELILKKTGPGNINTGKQKHSHRKGDSHRLIQERQQRSNFNK